MKTFLPVRLDQVAHYGELRFECPRCEGACFLSGRGAPRYMDQWSTPGSRLCDVCGGAAKVGFAEWARFKADDNYATSFLRRVLRALSSRDIGKIYLGLQCAEILHAMREATQCCRHKFKTFCSSTDDWARLEKRVARAKGRLNEACENYFGGVTQQRLERAALLRELQNEAAERSRQAREATRELEDKYLIN